MSKLLYNKQPLVIDSDLAKLIGLNETIILQQIKYWLRINEDTNKNFNDGYYWTYNSYEKWKKQFPFWSVKTIQRIISSLEKSGLLVTANYNTLKIDRTKWYRIDYKVLDSLETSPLGQNDQINRTDSPNQQDNLTKPLPEITTENITENIPKKLTLENPKPSLDEKDILFITTFFEYFGYNHRQILRTPIQTDPIIDNCEDDLIIAMNKFFDDRHLPNKQKNKEVCSIENWYENAWHYLYIENQ